MDMECWEGDGDIWISSDGRGMVIYGYGVLGGDLNLNCTDYPDHGTHGDPSRQGKTPMIEPGIEPGTS
jgi:hypothetical protein